MIYELTEELVRHEGSRESQYHEVAIRAMKLILGCADRSKLSPGAGDVFWTAVSNCQVKRKEIAMLLDPIRQQEGKKKLKPENVRDLMHDARIQIKKCIERQMGIKL